jgi:DNA-binding winged helix-turn-helix (wHTH) protein/predicted Zn-dependent protease
MGSAPQAQEMPEKIRFGIFEVDLVSRELRKRGSRISLEPQPFKILEILLRRHGETVTREEIVRQIWHSQQTEAFDQHLNQAIHKVRAALGDSAEHPLYIETITGSGFKFLGPIERTYRQAAPTPPAKDETDQPPGEPSVPAPSEIPTKDVHLSRRPIWLGMGIASTLCIAAICFWQLRSAPSLPFAAGDLVLIGDFENKTHDAQIGEALVTGLTFALEQSQRASIFPRQRAETVLRRMGKPPDTQITSNVGTEICQREGIRALISGTVGHIGKVYELIVNVIDPKSGVPTRSYNERAEGSERVLITLDALARKVRQDLGESLFLIDRADLPLPQVTTPSLPALKEYSLGKTMWRRGMYYEGIAHFDLAIAADPDFAMAHAAKGNAEYSHILNQPEEGRREFEKAVSLSSRVSERERLTIKVQYADSANHAFDAEYLMGAFLAQYPDDWPMRLQYARFLRSHGRNAEAVVEYGKLIKLDPNDGTLYVDLATAEKALSRYPEAIQAYHTAFQKEPELNRWNVSREYGFALVANGEETKATELFAQQLTDTATRETGLRSLALLDLLHGRCRSAQKRLEEALLINESNSAQLSIARVHLWLSYVFELMGKRREQRFQLDAAAQNLAKVGQKVIMGALIGCAYARAGYVPQARQILANISPDADQANKEQLAYLNTLKGNIETAEGHPDAAIDILHVAEKQADEEGPKIFELDALAFACMRAGKSSEEITYTEQLLATRLDGILWEPLPRWLAAHYQLAKEYQSRRQFAQSRQALVSLLKLWEGADPNLPLLRSAKALQRELAAANP